MFKMATGPNKIFMIDWSAANDTQFVSVGPKKVLFWDINTAGKTPPKGASFAGHETTNLLCVTHDGQGNAYCGG